MRNHGSRPLSHRIRTTGPWIANRDSRAYVEDKKPFNGSNMSGCLSVDKHRTVYVVWSYGTHHISYLWDAATDQWFGNENRYSRSTGRQMDQARPLGVDITWLPQDQLTEMFHRGYAGLVARRLSTGRK